jgi:membrane-bound ClpP family serine protease
VTDQSRSDQSAEIGARAHEIALGARSDIHRVEHSLSDQIKHLAKVVVQGFEKQNEKIDVMKAEIVKEITALQIADAKQSTAAKTLRYLFSALMALIMAMIAVVGLIWSMFAPGNPPHH